MSDFLKVTFKLDKRLSRIGAYIDDFLVCPHFTKKRYRNINESFFSNYRKPSSGMINTFIQKHRIHRNKSFMVGDSDKDILAGRNAGLKTILVSSIKIKDYKFDVQPNFRRNNLYDAVNLILEKN